MASHHNKKPKKENLLNKGSRLAGAGIQMGLTIYLFNWVGSWLDNTYQNFFLETLLTLLAIFASMYILIKQVQKLS